jgi:Skp family chaperone for outer membrane proteins
MKLKLLLALAFTLLASSMAFAQAGGGPAGAAAAPAGGQTKTKIAIVDVLAFREGVTKLKVKYEKLQAEFQSKYRELDAMATNVKAKEKVLQENKTLTPQQAAKLNDEYEQLKREYNRTLEDSQTQAGKREREETEAIYEELSKFMDRYCETHGITHVFDASRLRETQLVVYADARTNITEDFINEFNKANPAPAATAKQ